MDTRAIPPILLAGLLATSAPVSVLADPILEGRVARIERILENQAGSELLLQLQQLQMEMQELRGLVEMQQFELQRLQRQQRDQFLDIDARLGSERDQPPAEPIDPSDPNDRSLDDPATASMTGAGDPQAQPSTTVQAPTAGLGIPSLPAPETTGGNERDGYAAAFELLKQRKYDEAQLAFNELLRQYPEGQFSDNARYWLGETYYMQRNYPAALAEFDRIVQLHPNSTKVPGAMLKIGYIQYEQQAYDQASAALQAVVERYPNSTEARLAKSRLDRLAQDLR